MIDMLRLMALSVDRFVWVYVVVPVQQERWERTYTRLVGRDGFE